MALDIYEHAVPEFPGPWDLLRPNYNRSIQPVFDGDMHTLSASYGERWRWIILSETELEYIRPPEEPDEARIYEIITGSSQFGDAQDRYDELVTYTAKGEALLAWLNSGQAGPSDGSEMTELFFHRMISFPENQGDQSSTQGA